MRIDVAGAAGRMGQRILNLAAADPELSIGAAYDVPAHAGEALRLENGETITLSADARVAVAFTQGGGVEVALLALDGSVERRVRLDSR